MYTFIKYNEGQTSSSVWALHCKCPSSSQVSKPISKAGFSFVSFTNKERVDLNEIEKWMKKAEMHF